MNPLVPLLARQQPLILDGALATELERLGCDLRDPLWSAKVLIEEPALIKAVHRAYLQAGAEIVTTATYQATFEGFARRGIDQAHAAALFQLAVRLAVEARDEYLAETEGHLRQTVPLVAASIGSYGAYLADGSEYTGDYPLSGLQLQRFHRPRLAVLAETAADLLAFETIPSLKEALALADLLREFPGRSAWLSFSARDGAHTGHGEPVVACARALDRFEQIAAVGVNCTAPRHIPALIAALRRGTDKPIVVYPNSGETYIAAEHAWCGETDVADYAAQAARWREQGAGVIGGCCRTTPAHIRQLAFHLRG